MFDNVERKLLALLSEATGAPEKQVDAWLAGIQNLATVRNLTRDARTALGNARRQAEELRSEIQATNSKYLVASENRFLGPFLSPEIEAIATVEMTVDIAIAVLDRRLAAWPENSKDIRLKKVADWVAFLFDQAGKPLSTSRDFANAPFPETYGAAVAQALEIMGIKGGWQYCSETTAASYRKMYADIASIERDLNATLNAKDIDGTLEIWADRLAEIRDQRPDKAAELDALIEVRRRELG